MRVTEEDLIERKISLEMYIEAISAPINMIEAKITMPSWETFLYQGFYWEQL